MFFWVCIDLGEIVFLNLIPFTLLGCLSLSTRVLIGSGGGTELRRKWLFSVSCHCNSPSVSAPWRVILQSRLKAERRIGWPHYPYSKWTGGWVGDAMGRFCPTLGAPCKMNMSVLQIGLGAECRLWRRGLLFLWETLTKIFSVSGRGITPETLGVSRQLNGR